MGALSWLGTARAQEVQDTALARAMFQEGVTRADAGDWPGALDRFARAYALRPTSGVAFNLALAEIEAGQLLAASEHLQRVSRDESAPSALREQAEGRLRGVVPRLAQLTIDVSPTGDESAEVRLDDRTWPRAAWGVASPVDPGPHEVQVLRAGERVTSQRVLLGEGEHLQLVLAVPPAGAPEPAPHAALRVAPSVAAEPVAAPDRAPAHAPLTRRWALWTALGATAVAGVVAGALLLRRGDRASEEPIVGTGPGVQF